MNEQDEEKYMEQTLTSALKQIKCEYKRPIGKPNAKFEVVEVIYNVLNEETDKLEPERHFAVKVLSVVHGETEKYRKRELDVLESKYFLHTNIVKYYQWNTIKIDKKFFMCIRMELCGSNLWDFVYKNDIADSNDIIKVSSPVRLYQRIFPQILEGLSYIHLNGWVHRDIHPGNILIANPSPKQINDIVVKIADFGLARKIGPIIIDNSLPLTDAKKLEKLSPGVGSKLFRVPDDYQVDLYSAGIVLYFLSCHLDDNTKWPNEIENLKDGKRRSDNLYHKDDKTLVDLIQLLMSERGERPTAKKALEIAKTLAKHREVNEAVESVPLVESKQPDEATDGGARRGIAASLGAENAAGERAEDSTTHQVRKVYHFYVQAENDLAGCRCEITDALTLSNVQSQVEECTGIKAEDQKLEQTAMIDGIDRLHIRNDSDVIKMFHSAETENKKVVVHVKNNKHNNSYN